MLIQLLKVELYLPFTQQTINFSKSTIKTLKKGVEYVQSSQKDTRTIEPERTMDVVLVCLLFTLNKSRIFFWCFFVYFE